jgi:hypothetical protein
LQKKHVNEWLKLKKEQGKAESSSSTSVPAAVTRGRKKRNANDEKEDVS